MGCRWMEEGGVVKTPRPERHWIQFFGRSNRSSSSTSKGGQNKTYSIVMMMIVMGTCVFVQELILASQYYF
jgi:hypothetical protein